MLRNMFKKTYTLIDSKYKTPEKSEEPNIPEGLWKKCNKCGQPIYSEDVKIIIMSVPSAPAISGCMPFRELR